MSIKTNLMLGAVAAVSLLATAQVASAQPYAGDRGGGGYNAGYRAGYAEGYQDGRGRARYDDRPPSYGSNYRDDDDRDARWSGAGGGNQDDRWRHRYGQTYSYNDDSYYEECRNRPDPGGVLAGALIGGLLGNAAGHGNAGGTIAGVVVGGVAGAALTSHMECEDRSYAYKTYSDGFNSGRANSDWRWRNPQNGHYGTFRIGDYYNDDDGFRCATYTQQIWVNGSPQTTRGRACRQPDNTWAVVQ